MRRSVLIFGLVLWIVAGVLGWMLLSQRDQVGGNARDVVAVESDAADTSADGPTIVNPKGKRAIKIRVGEPEVDMVAPEGWEPPIVEGWELTNQNGDAVTPDDLLGKPYVGAFIFTRCTTHCPVLVRKVYDLEERLKDVDVRFVTVSVDPDYDTVEHLSKYAEVFTEDADRWMFLTGSKEEILDFARFGFRQVQTERPDAETFIGPEAAHSLRLMHVGADGRLIGTYHFSDDDDLTQLRRVLQGKSETKPEHEPLPPKELMIPAAFYLDDDAAGPDETQPNETQPVDAETVDEKLAKLPKWASRLPPIYTSMNVIATVLLVVAGVAIKRKKVRLHRNATLAAAAVSAVFLGCYLTYHWAFTTSTGLRGKPFPGEGIASTVYYSILIPHVLLAMTVPVLVGLAIWRAMQKRWQAHKRIVKWTYPIWLFVSVTGVVIYGMLYHWPPASA